MKLDVNTLYTITILVMALLGLLLILVWLQNRRMRALAWWGAAYLVGGMSVWLLGSHGSISDLLSIDLANALLFIACGLTWSGARLFDGRGIKPVAMLIGTFMWVGACQIPGFIASLDARVILSSVIISGYTMVIAFEFWRGRAEPLGSRWPAIIVLAAHSALFLLRVPFVFASSYDGSASSLFGNGWFTIIALESLLYAIAFAVIVVAMAKERGELKQKISALSDPLTGIANRRAFFDETLRRLDPANKDERPMAVVLFDLDRFKRVNDHFGHALGDKVLRIFAEKAKANLRPEDFVARLGGEEFAAVLSGVELSTAFMMAEQIRIAFAATGRQVDGYRVQATVSAGIALLPASEADVDALLARADQALYVAKARGRDRVEIAEVDRPHAWQPAEEEEWVRAPAASGKVARSAPRLVPSPALAPGDVTPIRKVGIH
ncbi:MAG TPA: GGDEF domain-containing protein [Xanthobacteraceae bacterium]|nr:GGDEF domain-containing protein [Xanthobacteraceae bacterium]